LGLSMLMIIVVSIPFLVGLAIEITDFLEARRGWWRAKRREINRLLKGAKP